jgi:DNA-binding LytR/AlgR family response regulator
MAKLILIIEDDIELRNYIKVLLETLKYSVIQAANGEEGIIKYNKCKPDLIICDITMPYVSGYEVLERLKKNNVPFLTPFIYLSGKRRHEDIRKGMELGADDYIYKPFDPGELLRAIQVRLDKYETIKKIVEEKKIVGQYSPVDKMFFNQCGNITPVIVENIMYIVAERQYTNIFIEGGKHFIQKKALNKWEELLPQNLFFRVHRATIVNRNYIKEIRKTNNSSYNLYIHNTSIVLKVSRRFFKNLRDIF